MDDTIGWALFTGLVIVVMILFWLRGSLQKALNEMRLQITAASAPVQALGPVVAGVNQAVVGLGSEIKAVSLQAEKIASYGERYVEAEKLTKDIHSVLIGGSYSKGKAGEEALRRSMIHLVKTGQVKTGQPLGGGVVEYAIVFRDGKMLAVDSKVVSTDEVNALSDEGMSGEDRAKAINKIKTSVRQKIPEVQKYIEPPRTLPMSVLALPDSIMDVVSDLIPEAMERNVILLGYSAVPQLIGYFVRIHESYTVEQDVATLKEKISIVQQELSTLDDKFFRNHIQKPLGTIDGAFDRLRSVVISMKNTLAFDAGEAHVIQSELPENPQEREIAPVPASS